VEILSLNEERSATAAIDFARKTFTYPLLPGASQVFRQYRVRVIPCTVIIGRDGTILTRHVGFAPGSERPLEDSLKRLLAPPAMSPALWLQPGPSR
jgi:hypothetical protein